MTTIVASKAYRVTTRTIRIEKTSINDRSTGHGKQLTSVHAKICTGRSYKERVVQSCCMNGPAAHMREDKISTTSVGNGNKNSVLPDLGRCQIWVTQSQRENATTFLE